MQPLRQKNEAKLQYWLLEEPSAAVLRVQLGKHIDTAQVDVDVQPSSVTVTVQVVVHEGRRSTAQHSTLTMWHTGPSAAAAAAV